MTRLLLLGAHLERQDAEGVEGLHLIDAPVTISALELADSREANQRATLVEAARLRQELIARETFVAIRYGATAGDDNEARNRCATHFDRWTDLLQRHRGSVEATLKIATGAKVSAPDRKDFRCGADYMRALSAARTAQLPSPEIRRSFESPFDTLSTDRRWIARPDGGSELAMLIHRENFARARDAAETLMKSISLPFMFSGPWPLETFVDE